MTANQERMGILVYKENAANEERWEQQETMANLEKLVPMELMESEEMLDHADYKETQAQPETLDPMEEEDPQVSRETGENLAGQAHLEELVEMASRAKPVRTALQDHRDHVDQGVPLEFPERLVLMVKLDCRVVVALLARQVPLALMERLAPEEPLESPGKWAQEATRVPQEELAQTADRAQTVYLDRKGNRVI